MALATIFGTIMGAVAGGILDLFLWMVVVGGGLTAVGVGISGVKKSEWESHKAYIFWMVIGICAIAVGIMSFVGAIIGLYFHQIGAL